MDDAECREVFSQLASMLKELDRGWIVDQVLEHIRAGKVIHFDQEYPMSTNKSSEARAFYATSRERTKGVMIDSYSSREQLDLLIAAIEQVAAEIIGIEKDVTAFSRASGFSGEVIIQDEERESLTISEARTQEQLADVGWLHRLLLQLREGVDGNDHSA